MKALLFMLLLILLAPCELPGTGSVALRFYEVCHAGLPKAIHHSVFPRVKGKEKGQQFTMIFKKGNVFYVGVSIPDEKEVYFDKKMFGDILMANLVFFLRGDFLPNLFFTDVGRKRRFRHFLFSKNSHFPIPMVLRSDTFNERTGTSNGCVLQITGAPFCRSDVLTAWDYRIKYK